MVCPTFLRPLLAHLSKSFPITFKYQILLIQLLIRTSNCHLSILTVIAWIQVNQRIITTWMGPTLCDPMDCIACQAPLSLGFSRQEYWSGLPCLLQGNLPNQGIKPRFLTLQADYLLTATREALWLPIICHTYFCFIDYAKAFDCVDHSKLWKILKEMGIPDHLTCLLRNLYAGQEATVRTGHGTTDWF